MISSVIAEAGTAEFWKGSIESYAGFVPSAGLITHAEAAEWRDELMAISARGEFFSSCVYYAYIAYKDAN